MMAGPIYLLAALLSVFFNGALAIALASEWVRNGNLSLEARPRSHELSPGQSLAIAIWVGSSLISAFAALAASL